MTAIPAMLRIITIRDRDILQKVQEIRSHAVQTTARAHPILHPLTIRVQVDLIAEPVQADLPVADPIAGPVQAVQMVADLITRQVQVGLQETDLLNSNKNLYEKNYIYSLTCAFIRASSSAQLYGRSSTFFNRR